MGAIVAADDLAVAPISKRSPMLLLLAAGGLFIADTAGGGDAAADEKSPQSPPPKLSFRGTGAGAAAGWKGGGAGLA